mgnify:CR=1 FL=1
MNIAAVVKAGGLCSRFFGYFSCRLPLINVIATQTPLAITNNALITTRTRISDSISRSGFISFNPMSQGIGQKGCSEGR